MLTGAYRRDAGTIFLGGEAIDPRDVMHAQELGIGTVYQEVNLLPNLTVAENLFLGRQPTRFGFVDSKAAERRSREILAGYGLSIDVTALLGSYSVAIQQIVAIARAVDISGKVLILDEPTASLDADEVSRLFAIIGGSQGPRARHRLHHPFPRPGLSRRRPGDGAAQRPPRRLARRSRGWSASTSSR